jgi:hypothetical protein
MSLNIGAITTGVQTVTAVGAVTPTAGLSTATVPATTTDFTIFCEVQALTDGTKARIVIEETATAAPYSATNWLPLLIYDVEGAVTSAADIIKSVRKYEVPGNALGTSGSCLRANVYSMSDSGPLSLRAWIEY